jgi:hypothetical protein
MKSETVERIVAEPMQHHFARAGNRAVKRCGSSPGRRYRYLIKHFQQFGS